MVKIRRGDRVVSVGPQTAKVLIKRRGWEEVVPEPPKPAAPKPKPAPRKKG